MRELPDKPYVSSPRPTQLGHDTSIKWQESAPSELTVSSLLDLQTTYAQILSSLTP